VAENKLDRVYRIYKRGRRNAKVSGALNCQVDRLRWWLSSTFSPRRWPRRSWWCSATFLWRGSWDWNHGERHIPTAILTWKLLYCASWS